MSHIRPETPAETRGSVWPMLFGSLPRCGLVGWNRPAKLLCQALRLQTRNTSGVGALIQVENPADPPGRTVRVVDVHGQITSVVELARVGDLHKGLKGSKLEGPRAVMAR
jgi:hypothetical protein